MVCVTTNKNRNLWISINFVPIIPRQIWIKISKNSWIVYELLNLFITTGYWSQETDVSIPEILPASQLITFWIPWNVIVAIVKEAINISWKTNLNKVHTDWSWMLIITVIANYITTFSPLWFYLLKKYYVLNPIPCVLITMKFKIHILNSERKGFSLGNYKFSVIK